jgi:hypothetical protein
MSQRAIIQILKVILQNQLAIMRSLPHQTIAVDPKRNELHDRIKLTEEWMHGTGGGQQCGGS